MYTVNLQCGECDSEFTYSGKEYKRQTEKFDRSVFYCSRSCACKAGNKRKQADPIYRAKQKIALKAANKTYTEQRKFSRFISLCKRRKNGKGHIVEITESDIDELWNLQNHKCALTGIEMSLERKLSPSTLSVDRIDSSIGYLRSNIQLVCYSANLAKSSFANDEFRLWIKQVVSMCP